MAGEGGPEDDLELDPPLPDENEPEDLQDQALVEDEADEESDKDEIDASDQQQGDRQQPDQQRQPSRRDRRIEALTTSLAEERRQREELNRRLDAVLTGQQPRQPQGETPEQRAQRLALLTPEERIREELNEAKHGFAVQMQRMQFTSQDGADRAAFQAKATVDPLYKKWSDKVEAELTTLRNQGMNTDREKLMYYLIGKAAVEGRQANGARERVQAQRRVQQQRTRPANSGSDVAPRRDRGSSLERRLENVEL